MARALGGEVTHDPSRAELGTLPISVTQEGLVDPVFGALGSQFDAQMGHEDRVVSLPDDAVRLAFTNKVDNQAFRFADRPMYCTQFHPELDRQAMLERLEAYPEYVQRIAGVSFSEFISACRETPEANELMRRFTKHVLREW